MALPPASETGMRTDCWARAGGARKARASSQARIALPLPRKREVELLRRCGLAEGRYTLSAVLKSLRTFGGEVFHVVQRALNIVLPDVLGQVVHELDAIAVGIVDVEAVGHAVLDPAVEFHTFLLQVGEVLHPGLSAGHGDGDVVDR